MSAPVVTPKLVVVCGSRYWRSRGTIASCLRSARAQGFTHVVHGGCRGADAIAGEEAERLGLQVVVVPALWHRYGKGAGTMRNAAMLELGPQLVLAFAQRLSLSRGTGYTVQLARAFRIPVRVFHQ